MAMTKVEAAKLTQDMMLKGVIETIVTESMILELLPFMEVRDTVRGDRMNLMGSPSVRCMDPSLTLVSGRQLTVVDMTLR